MTQQIARATPLGREREISYEQFLAGFTNGEHVEWVEGEVVRMPAVTNTHADLTLFVATLFRFVVDFRQFGIVRTEPYNMKLAPNLPGRSPDVLVVRRENLGRVQEDHL